MDGSYVDDALSAAEDSFRGRADGAVESGLEIDDGTLVQLRKGCRLLEAARTLRERNGYHTVVIEACFVAIERSIQSHLFHRDHVAVEELRHEHTAVYRRGASANLFSDEFADRLVGLWQQNRAEVYYRDTVASGEQADAMVALAEAVHRYVLDFASLGHVCVCTG